MLSKKILSCCFAIISLCCLSGFSTHPVKPELSQKPLYVTSFLKAATINGVAVNIFVYYDVSTNTPVGAQVFDSNNCTEYSLPSVSGGTFMYLSGFNWRIMNGPMTITCSLGSVVISGTVTEAVPWC